MERRYNIIACFFVVGVLLFPAASFAATVALTVGEVDTEFRTVFGRAPTTSELDYWKSRRADKKTREALRGAMSYAKSQDGGSATPKISSTKDLITAVPRAFQRVFGRPPKGDEKVWWADRVRCGNLKTYDAVLSSMTFHKKNKVTKGTGTKDAFCAPKTSGGISLNTGLGIGGNARGPVVKIGIWNAPKEVKVTANGVFRVVRPEGGTKNFKEGDILRVALSGSNYRVTGPGFNDTYEGPVKVSPMGGSILEIANYVDRGASGRNYNRFRGNIIVRKATAGGLWAINELPTEDYVRGLGETTDSAPEQFQRALATAARTYVLHHMTRGGRQPANGFDIGNTPNDQIYRGYNYEAAMPGFASRVKETVGQVVTHSGDLIAAVYFSGSDGRTRSAEEVWRSSKFPYLQSKKDPYGGRTLRGHGTGLSGDGAVGFARRDGWDYKKILTYYYTGVKIERGY